MKLENASDALYEAYASKGPEWHQQMSRRLLRKVDLHLLPFLVLMYLLNFLDRKYVSLHERKTKLTVSEVISHKPGLVHWKRTWG
jgi:hypothetical protein